MPQRPQLQGGAQLAIGEAAGEDGKSAELRIGESGDGVERFREGAGVVHTERTVRRRRAYGAALTRSGSPLAG